MARIGTIGVLAMMIAVAIGGCAESDGSEPQSQRNATPSASATDTTGGINGRVVDDESLPVADASVGVRRAGESTGNRTTTASDGSFSFSGLDPGPHEVVVQSALHDQATRTVTVIAGQVVDVEFELRSIPAVVERFVDIVIEAGYIACSVGWRNPTNPSTSGGNPIASNPCYQIQGDKSDFVVPIDLDLPFREIILELVWTPGTGFSGSRLRMDFCSEKPDENNYFAQCKIVSGSNPYATAETGPSPLILRRNDVPVDSISEFEVAIGDGGYDLSDPSTLRVPITFQQSFDLYMSMCYYDNCTADHQVRPE